MDQIQVKQIEAVASELAESVHATELAEDLQLAKLVRIEQIEDIFNNTDSNYCRNLRLFEAVQRCDSATAFDDFVRVLERVDPDHAPRLLASSSSLFPKSKNKDKKQERSLIGRMIDRLSRHSTGQYPLGMRSSLSSTTSPTSFATGIASNDSSATLSSPLKEKHQATLICSATSSQSTRESQPEQQQQSQQSSIPDSGYRLALRYPAGQLPVTPPTVSQNSHRPANAGDRVNQDNMNKFSQTPNRHERRLVNNLSLSEEDEEEPVVCWHPYAQSPGQESAGRAASPHRCHPSYSSASSESGESTSDSLMVDPNIILDPNVMAAIAREGPNMMKVKMATVCHNNLEEDYKMTARPRGKCLIVNNINFENEIFPTRKGSDEDANRFDLIFKQLGFETIMTRNLTAEAMKYKFKELAAACKPEHDALFVFILSHGSEHGIYGTDGFEVCLESEIISCFDNRNCKAMIGKPKVFVIQACRGRAKDCGGDGDATDSIAWTAVDPSATTTPSSQENRVPASWLPSSHQPSDSKKRKHPIRTDMLLVFSCLAG